VRARSVLVTSVGLCAAAVGFGRYRDWHLGWGATDEERSKAMPGDELLATASFEPTRAITIEAPPAVVWPWLVQIGYGRAGFYSYDLLDNLGRPSEERIVPDLQDLKVGDWIPMGPSANEETAFLVQALEAPHYMVWSKPSSTWAWVLTPLVGDRTRLVTRIRVRYRWRSPWIVPDLILMELGDFWMMHKELRSIRERAERAARSESLPM